MALSASAPGKWPESLSSTIVFSTYGLKYSKAAQDNVRKVLLTFRWYPRVSGCLDFMLH